MKEEKNNTIKSDWDLKKCFEQLRFDKNHHLGLGDIRLTIAQQEEICRLIEHYYIKKGGQTMKLILIILALSLMGCAESMKINNKYPKNGSVVTKQY